MIKKYLSIILSGLLMASCVDTVILPYDKTVDEDFWQTKSDVSLMVNGAYQSMLSSNIIMRLIVWGDFRSDELIRVTSVTEDDLAEIETINIETTNAYANWASFYSVINDCNIVLEKAPAVTEIDPSYTEGDMLADRAQMLALRSLCYFYLVRNFRDVPYSSTAYMNSSQEFNIGQSAPDSVLACCIADLEEASQNILAADAYTDWRRVGYFNKDGVNALLADIYLWRASVLHSDSDYQKCIEYCDLVIQSKQDQHEVMPGEIETSVYPLDEGDETFINLYVLQNAEESIFELQFDGSNNSNTGLCQALNRYSSSATSSYMVAPQMFGLNGEGNVFFQTSDLRYYNACYEVGSGADNFKVRKGVTQNPYYWNNPQGKSGQTSELRAYNGYSQNYIVYRLADVLLMKAEAMTQLATGNDDIQLRQAFNIVQEVNKRALYSGTNSDSLKWSAYNTVESMETLVLAERLRELCFEGKRWYDLLRYNYRHVEGVDYSTTLAEQNENGVTFVENTEEMRKLMARKLSSSSLPSKMRTEPYLYMPVLQDQIEVNPNLKQNPVYSSSDVYEKN